jgi:hypothetical protein
LPAQLRPRLGLERLLARPDAAKLVRATPAQPLFLFIKELGLADASELLALCATEQVQAFLDMDGWQGDRLIAARVWPWIAALCELGAQKLAAHVQRLDGEFLTSVLAPRLRIYELAEEEPPEESEGLLYATPDRFYLIDILPGPEGDGDSVLLRRFLDELYSADLDLARSVIQAARWDAGAETEETAYRFRSGRMADLGYIEYYEALKVYMLLDPLSPTPAERASASDPAPPVLKEGTQGLVFLPGLEETDSTFARAALYLPETERSLLFQHLLLLGNRVMAADRVELGDAEAARVALHRTIGNLSLGLEFLLLPTNGPGGRGAGVSLPVAPANVQVNVAMAAKILRETSLLYLFRVGHSLTMQLRKLATLLLSEKEEGLGSLLPSRDLASLLPPRLGEPLRSLLFLRPLYSTYLDREHHPPRDIADDAKVPPPRPFMGLRDFGHATQFLSELSTVAKFLTTGLGLRTDNLAQTLHSTVPSEKDVQLIDILGTMVGNLLLRHPPVLVPIRRHDLLPLRRIALGDAGLGATALQPAVAAEVRATLKSRVKERALNEKEVAELWTSASALLLDETLDALGRSLGTLPPELSAAHADAVTRLSGLILA